MYLSVKEAAQKLAVTPAAVYAAIREHRLPSEQQQGKTWVREADLDEYRNWSHGPGRGPRQNKPFVRRNIMQLRGLGREIWQGIDAKEFVNTQRREWSEHE